MGAVAAVDAGIAMDKCSAKRAVRSDSRMLERNSIFLDASFSGRRVGRRL